jgi:hypothetical protein
MFKKLKQKIEDGGESGLEKVSFKLPGSVIRSNSPHTGERTHSPELDLVPDHLPTLTSEVPVERVEQVSKGIIRYKNDLYC